MTADSLAAESLKSGGDFAATTGAAASSVPSKSSTAANTDISGATVLDAAPDAEARQTTEGWNESAQLNAGRNLGRSSGGSGGADVQDSGIFKPKGEGLTEGGFDSGAPNASFNQAIGTNKDPGREALASMLKSDAQNAADSGAPKDSGISRDGQYDVLKDASA